MAVLLISFCLLFNFSLASAPLFTALFVNVCHRIGIFMLIYNLSVKKVDVHSAGSDNHLLSAILAWLCFTFLA